LLKHILGLIVKSLSNTRWESRLKSEKAIRHQVTELRSALSQLCHSSHVEAKDKTDAKYCFDAPRRIEFLIDMFIWHDILFAVNKVSKMLQSPSMCTEPTLKQYKVYRNFLRTTKMWGFL
jgi:hypothetical protein